MTTSYGSQLGVAAWIWTHRPLDYPYILHGYSLTEELIQELHGGTLFPLNMSLYKREGQKWLLSAVKRHHKLRREAPRMALAKLSHLDAVLAGVRKDTALNARQVAEALMVRGAAEFTPRIAYAANSLQLWFEIVHDRRLSWTTLKTAITKLEAGGLIAVRWSRYGNSFNLRFNPDDKAPLHAADDWMTEVGGYLDRIYASERQRADEREVRRDAEHVRELRMSIQFDQQRERERQAAQDTFATLHKLREKSPSRSTGPEVTSMPTGCQSMGSAQPPGAGDGSPCRADVLDRVAMTPPW